MRQEEENDLIRGNEPLNTIAIAKQLELVQIECKEYKEKLYRALTEIENLRIRFKIEKENERKFALQNFVSRILPAKDSLEKGLKIAYSDNYVDEDVLISGMTATLKICFDALSANGVEEINPIGKNFNSEFHEALNIKKDKSVAKNIILKVYQKGYMLNGRLIRPARVEVSAG